MTEPRTTSPTAAQLSEDDAAERASQARQHLDQAANDGTGQELAYLRAAYLYRQAADLLDHAAVHTRRP